MKYLKLFEDFNSKFEVKVYKQKPGLSVSRYEQKTLEPKQESIINSIVDEVLFALDGFYYEEDIQKIQFWEKGLLHETESESKVVGGFLVDITVKYSDAEDIMEELKSRLKTKYSRSEEGLIFVTIGNSINTESTHISFWYNMYQKEFETWNS